MSKLGQILWMVCGALLVPFLSVRFILGYWHPFLLYILALPILAFVAALIVDRRFYFELFTVRTTKHGLNMGVLIFLVFTLIVTVNVVTLFFRSLENKVWDVTEEKLHSLSPQSKKVLKNLEEDLSLKVFYGGQQMKAEALGMQNNLKFYVEASPRVKLELVDAYVENKLAQKYFQDENTPQIGLALFVEYKEGHVRVELSMPGAGNWEEQITNAIVKVSRSSQKVVYFLTGHGEREEKAPSFGGGPFSSPHQQLPEGIGEFKKALRGSGFILKNLNLVDKKEMPKDINVLVVLGPQSPLFESESKLIKSYMEEGGRLFVALDPGQRHNMGPFLKFLGVDFKNNIVRNDQYRILGLRSISILGLKFDSVNSITKDLSKSRAGGVLFNVVSEVVPFEENKKRNQGFKFTQLVQSHPRSYILEETSAEKKNENKKIRQKRKRWRSYNLALLSEGNLSKDKASSFDSDKEKEKAASKEEKSKDFKALVFGDSDFLLDQNLSVPSHRNLVLNSISYLLDEGDLLSIRSKQINRVPFKITAQKFNAVVIGGVFLPVILFWLSAWFWFRRRNA